MTAEQNLAQLTVSIDGMLAMANDDTEYVRGYRSALEAVQQMLQGDA